MPATKSILFFSTMLLLAAALVLFIIFGASFFSRLAGGGGKNTNPQLEPSVVQQLGMIKDHRLTEISGIALSIRHKDCFWVHNDSGNSADLFMISEKGKTLARVVLSGARNIDWEDVCSFTLLNKPYICVGDVGDNSGRRKNYQLYIFEEPDLNTHAASKTELAAVEIDDFITVEFKYQDGPKNCEAIAFDPKQTTVFLAEKRLDRESRNKTGIYHLLLNPRLAARSTKNPIATKIAETPLVNATAMDISTDGKQLVIGTYRSAAFFSRKDGASWPDILNLDEMRFIPLPVQRQGEAICFSADGRSTVVTSEMSNQPIWKINTDAAFDSLNPTKN